MLDKLKNQNIEPFKALFIQINNFLSEIEFWWIWFLQLSLKSIKMMHDVIQVKRWWCEDMNTYQKLWLDLNHIELSIKQQKAKTRIYNSTLTWKKILSNQNGKHALIEMFCFATMHTYRFSCIADVKMCAEAWVSVIRHLSFFFSILHSNHLNEKKAH